MRGRECLRALRAHMVAAPDAAPAIEDGHVALGGTRFEAGASTGYLSSRGGAGAYTLDSVVLLLTIPKSSEYMKTCLSRSVKAVALADQADLKAYVTGAAADSAQLEEVEEAGGGGAAVPLPDLAAAAPARGNEEAAGGLENKAAEEDEYYDGVSLGSRNDGLCVPGKDFSFALELYDRFRKRERDAAEAGRRDEERAKREERHRAKRARENPGTAASDPKRRKPGDPKRESGGIIIVPNAMTSILQLLNAADFLERGKYVSPAEKRAAGAKKEPSIKIERTKEDGTIQTFRIVDNPQRLNDADWARVVAVFALGAAWQFKGWKYAQPVDLFQRVLGVHLKFDDAETLTTVKNWNVKVLSVNKFKRHLDGTTAVMFWRLLDDFMAKRKAQRPHK